MKKSKKKKKDKTRYAVMKVSGISHVFKFDEPWLRCEATKFYPHKSINKTQADSLVAEFPNREWYNCTNKKCHGFCIATDADIAARDEKAKVDSREAEVRKEASKKALAAGALPILLNMFHPAYTRNTSNRKSMFMDEKGNKW